MKAFNPLKYVLILYFFIPYLLLFNHFNFNLQIDHHELWWAFKNSFLQSVASTLIVMLLSIPMSLGMFQLKGRSYTIVSKLLLLPQILPSLFSILIAFSIWKPFPLGTLGIGFIFTLVYLGFAVIVVHTATLEKLGSFPVVGQVFGLRRLQFFNKIYFPILRGDLVSCSLMIFIFCFSSFSIPLVAGGGKDTNIEILVFEKIFINQDYSSAWTIGILQSLFLTVMSFILIRNQTNIRQEFSYSNYLNSTFGYVAIAFYLFLYIGGYLFGLVQALPELAKFTSFYEDIWSATLNSLQLFLVYFALCATILFLWLNDFSRNFKLNIANHFIASSTILVGFSFYLYFPQSENWDLIKIPFAMSILIFPILFRSFLERNILDLKDQIIAARVFGIRLNQIVVQLVLKRIQRPLAIWFSFLVIWFLSDFAVMRALGTQTKTLGLMAQNFLSSYRLSLAYLLSFYILVVWIFILLGIYLFLGVCRVANKKFKFTI